MAKCSDLSKSDGPLLFRYPDLGFGFSHTIKNLEFEPMTRASSTKLLNRLAPKRSFTIFQHVVHWR